MFSVLVALCQRLRLSRRRGGDGEERGGKRGGGRRGVKNGVKDGRWIPLAFGVLLVPRRSVMLKKGGELKFSKGSW